jgi:hypothetical protein
MGLTLVGLATPVALALVAFLGYCVGRRNWNGHTDRPAEQHTQEKADAIIERIEHISNQLRQSMATRHSTVNRCREQIRLLSEAHSPESDSARHIHLQAMLGPTERLTHEIAIAYDELRQHSRHLEQLRTDHVVAQNR